LFNGKVGQREKEFMRIGENLVNCPELFKILVEKEANGAFAPKDNRIAIQTAKRTIKICIHYLIRNLTIINSNF